MKKRSRFRQKEFYLVLLLCFVSVLTLVTIIYGENKKGQEKADPRININEPIDIVDNITTTKTIDMISDKEPNDLVDVIVPIDKEPVVNTPTENDPVVDTTSVEEPPIEDDEQPTPPKKVEEDTSGTEVKKPIKEEFYMVLPIQGEIMLPYSMDKLIYFTTLNQYKCNPAMCIKAEENSVVSAAAGGTVESIEDSEENGKMVVIKHIDGYKSYYGQLKDIAVKVGDKIEMNAPIAKVAKPTRFYVKEGVNLFFKVTKDSNTIDPMSVITHGALAQEGEE